MASLWRREDGTQKREGGSEKGALLCLWGSARRSSPSGVARLDSLQRVEGSFVWKSSDSLLNLQDRLAECDSAGAGNMDSGNTHNWWRRTRRKKRGEDGGRGVSKPGRSGVKARQSKHGGHRAHAPRSLLAATYLSWTLITPCRDKEGVPVFSVCLESCVCVCAPIKNIRQPHHLQK